MKRIKLWELLSKPGAWTQGVAARDAQGECVTSTSAKAVSWCLVGAISYLYDERDLSVIHQTDEFRKIRKSFIAEYGKSVTDWNDAKNRTQEEVVALCKSLDI